MADLLDDELPRSVPRAIAPEPVPQRKLESRTVLEWGTAKGHNPKPGPVRRGKQHTGPHVFVVLTHLGGGNARAWPENRTITEAEYDAAITAAYGITLR